MGARRRLRAPAPGRAHVRDGGGRGDEAPGERHRAEEGGELPEANLVELEHGEAEAGGDGVGGGDVRRRRREEVGRYARLQLRLPPPDRPPFEHERMSTGTETERMSTVTDTGSSSYSKAHRGVALRGGAEKRGERKKADLGKTATPREQSDGSITTA